MREPARSEIKALTCTVPRRWNRTNNVIFLYTTLCLFISEGAWYVALISFYMKALKAHQSYIIFDLKLFSEVYNIYVSKRKVCTQGTKDVALIVTLQEKYSIRQEHV